ncbi:hypothetical protein Trydic_g20091 [Trypoxylus dichotomus]
MSRLNGRLASAPPDDPSQDFEPSCLVRTPSGSVYIRTDTLSKSVSCSYDVLARVGGEKTAIGREREYSERTRWRCDSVRVVVVAI